MVRRDKDHLMKFMLGELGTAGKIDGNRAIFNGKFEELPDQFPGQELRGRLRDML